MTGLSVLLFLDISGGELLVILLVVFLVFGPEKMPEMARKAGRMMNQMKKATNDLTNEFKKETSVLQNEIKSAHTKVNEQIDSVSREINRTKSQVVQDMTVSNSDTETTDGVKPAESISEETSNQPDPAKSIENPVISK
jgi:sec-independent protein translocase protein TatA